MNAQSPSTAQVNKFNQLVGKFQVYDFDLPQELLPLLVVAEIDFDHIFYKLELCTALIEDIQTIYQISQKDLISLQLGVLFSSLSSEGVDVRHFCELDLFQLDEKTLTQIDRFVLMAIFWLILGFDTSLTHSTTIVDIDSSPQGIHIRIDGPQAYSDSIPAQAESRLLAQVLRIPIFVLCDQPPTNAQLKTLPVDLGSIGVTKYDEMSEAGRKILRFHFARMAYHEPGTRRGEDIEELHDMRVATRRMRSAIGSFRPYLRKKAIRPFVRDLRATGLVLGAVRDMDVFLENLESDIASRPEVGGLDLSALIGFWREKIELARSNMIHHLDNQQYQKFLLDFSRFLNTPFVGVKKYVSDKSQVRTVQTDAALLIKNHWANIQSFTDEIASASVERLHILRIEIKKLRYAVEFLRDVLGYESEEIIAELKQIQDHLGKLNDSVVASKMTSEFLRDVKRKQFDISNSDWAASAEEYLFLKKEECTNRATTFPEVWFKITRSGFEQKLFKMVSDI